MKKLAVLVTVFFVCCSLAAGAYAEEVHNGATVLHWDTILQRNNYEIGKVYSSILTDRAMDRGWFFNYLETDLDGAEPVLWEPSEDSYTTVMFSFSCTNLGDNPCKFAEASKIRIVFDEGKNEKIYEGFPFQSNPGQRNSDGAEGSRSSVCRAIGKNETATVSFLIDVDRAFHDSIVSKNSDHAVWAYIDFIDDDHYCFDMKNELYVYGYDDFNSDSIITGDIHQIRESATGIGYLEEFLTNNSDFSQIVEKSGISVKELAENMADDFTIRVTDIQYSDENHASAYCTLVSPDFIAMYQAMGEIQTEQLKNLDPSSVTENEFYAIIGGIFMDYTRNNILPSMTYDFVIDYHFDEELWTWIPEDWDTSMFEMRIALLNF